MGVGKRMKSTLVGCNSMFTSWLVRNLTWHKVLYIYRLQYIVSISPGEWNKNSLRTAPECWWKLPTIETTSLLPRTAWKLMTEASASSSSGNRNTTSTGYSFLCYSTLPLYTVVLRKFGKYGDSSTVHTYIYLYNTSTYHLPSPTEPITQRIKL